MDKLIVQVPNYQRNKNVGIMDQHPMPNYRYMLSCSCIRYGPQLKMLGKSLTFDCDVYKGPVGSKIGNAFSFSGASRLRSATTNVSPTYYTRHIEYMKGRASTYKDEESIHFVDGVAYSNTPVTTTTGTCAKEVVYKRSNPTFGHQGAVDSSLRSAKLVYDTVRVNPYNPLKKTQQPYSGCTTGCS
jgi:hypothetical protein